MSSRLPKLTCEEYIQQTGVTSRCRGHIDGSGMCEAHRPRLARVYLAGAILGCSDAEAKDWRAEARLKLEALRFTVFDPMVRDYRGRETEPGIAALIVEQDKVDIDGVDALLVYIEKPSAGTSMEMLYAFERGKQIVVVYNDAKTLSPWIVYHSNHVVKTVAEAIDWLMLSVGPQPTLDPCDSCDADQVCIYTPCFRLAPKTKVWP